MRPKTIAAAIVSSALWGLVGISLAGGVVAGPAFDPDDGPEGSWVTLMAEGLEGVFPSPLWHIGTGGLA